MPKDFEYLAGRPIGQAGAQFPVRDTLAKAIAGGDIENRIQKYPDIETGRQMTANQWRAIKKKADDFRAGRKGVTREMAITHLRNSSDDKLRKLPSGEVIDVILSANDRRREHMRAGAMGTFQRALLNVGSGGKNAAIKKAAMSLGKNIREDQKLAALERKIGVPVRPAGLKRPESARNQRVAVQGLHEPVENPELAEESLRALLGGSSHIPMAPGTGVAAATQIRVPEFPFAR